MPMRLAPMRAEDRDRVSELLTATHAFAEGEIGVALELFDVGVGGRACRPEPSDGPAPAIADLDYEFVGAYDDAGQLAGYACFGPTPATDGTYDLYWLAVDPSAQGQGTGCALVRWVEQQLATRGARLLVVETSSRADYADTRQFYARSGYAETATVRDFYAPGDDRIILTTRLTTRQGGVATR